MAINFAQMESHDYSSGMSKYPTRQQQKFYMCKNAFHINPDRAFGGIFSPNYGEAETFLPRSFFKRHIFDAV